MRIRDVTIDLPANQQIQEKLEIHLIPQEIMVLLTLLLELIGGILLFLYP